VDAQRWDVLDLKVNHVMTMEQFINIGNLGENAVNINAWTEK